MHGSRNFRRGGGGGGGGGGGAGGGGGGRLSSDNLFFFFFGPQLGQFQRNLSFFQGSRGGPTFSKGGGVQLFPEGGCPIAFSL